MHENLTRIKAVSQVLDELGQDFVFVGGATVSLYATDTALAEEVRPTDDVDVVIELASYGGYAEIDAHMSGGYHSEDANYIKLKLLRALEVF